MLIWYENIFDLVFKGMQEFFFELYTYTKLILENPCIHQLMNTPYNQRIPIAWKHCNVVLFYEQEVQQKIGRRNKISQLHNNHEYLYFFTKPKIDLCQK